MIDLRGKELKAEVREKNCLWIIRPTENPAKFYEDAGHA